MASMTRISEHEKQRTSSDAAGAPDFLPATFVGDAFFGEAFFEAGFECLAAGLEELASGGAFDG
jgi:hypothetical protein